jgi:hypothetical protein
MSYSLPTLRLHRYKIWVLFKGCDERLSVGLILHDIAEKRSLLLHKQRYEKLLLRQSLVMDSAASVAIFLFLNKSCHLRCLL